MEAARSMRSSSNSWWHTSATHFQSMRWFWLVSLQTSIRMEKYRKHCQRHNGPKSLSTLTHSKHKETSASKYQPNSSLKISTKLKPQKSASKSWSILSPNIVTNLLSFKISTKVQSQNLDQTSISWPKFRCEISTQPQLQNLDQTSLTRSSASTSATLTKSRSFDLASSKARVTSVKSTEQQPVSQF